MQAYVQGGGPSGGVAAVVASPEGPFWTDEAGALAVFPQAFPPGTDPKAKQQSKEPLEAKAAREAVWLEEVQQKQAQRHSDDARRAKAERAMRHDAAEKGKTAFEVTQEATQRRKAEEKEAVKEALATKAAKTYEARALKEEGKRAQLEGKRQVLAEKAAVKEESAAQKRLLVLEAEQKAKEIEDARVWAKADRAAAAQRTKDDAAAAKAAEAAAKQQQREAAAARKAELSAMAPAERKEAKAQDKVQVAAEKEAAKANKAAEAEQAKAAKAAAEAAAAEARAAAAEAVKQAAADEVRGTRARALFLFQSGPVYARVGLFSKVVAYTMRFSFALVLVLLQLNPARKLIFFFSTPGRCREEGIHRKEGRGGGQKSGSCGDAPSRRTQKGRGRRQGRGGRRKSGGEGARREGQSRREGSGCSGKGRGRR